MKDRTKKQPAAKQKPGPKGQMDTVLWGVTLPKTLAAWMEEARKAVLQTRSEFVKNLAMAERNRMNGTALSAVAAATKHETEFRTRPGTVADLVPGVAAPAENGARVRALEKFIEDSQAASEAAAAAVVEGRGV